MQIEELEVATVSEEVPVAEQEEVSEETEVTEEEAVEEEPSEEEVVEEDEHKKTANERIRELIDRSKKAEEDLNDLKQKFEAEQKQKELAQKPYYDLDMERIEADIASMYDQVEELRLEGKTLAAAEVQRKIVKLLDAVDKNEETKKKWVAEQELRNSEETKSQGRLKEIEDAANFYQKQLSIPDDVWKAGGEWLRTELDKNPVLGKKFVELIDRQGAVAGVEWAHQYIIQNMGKEAKENKEKKDAAKKQNIGGTTATASSGNVPKSFDELMNLKSTEIVALEKSNPKLFNKLINDKMNRR